MIQPVAGSKPNSSVSVSCDLANDMPLLDWFSFGTTTHKLEYIDVKTNMFGNLRQLHPLFQLKFESDLLNATRILEACPVLEIFQMGVDRLCPGSPVFVVRSMKDLSFHISDGEPTIMVDDSEASDEVFSVMSELIRTHRGALKRLDKPRADRVPSPSFWSNFAPFAFVSGVLALIYMHWSREGYPQSRKLI